MEENNMSINGELPKNVNIRDKQGNVSIMPYRELKHHEESIIEDNVMFGIMHAIYSDSEIDKYGKQARAEWKDLKNKLRNNPELVLILDETTERYIPYVEKSNVIPFSAI